MGKKIEVERVYDDNDTLIKKECTKCHKLLDVCEYHKSKKHLDGLSSNCRWCRNKKTKKWVEERKKEKVFKYKYNTGENLRKFDAEGNIIYKKCSSCNQWKSISEFRKNSRQPDGYHNQCNDCHLDCSRKRLQTPEGKAVHRKNVQKRRTKKLGNGGTWTLEQWNQCLEYFNYRDAYTGLPMDIISIDHVIPVSKGGTSFIHNLVACDKNINSSKNNNDLFEWYSKQEFFDLGRYLKICLWIIKNGGADNEQRNFR